MWGAGSSKDDEEEKARRERLVSEKVERDVEAVLAKPGAVLQKKREGGDKVEEDVGGRGW